MTELLQEYVDSGGVALSVDHELGILRGVKLIGLESRNGRRYRESALAAAATLYEEAKVNVNHPKDGPLSPRDYQDRLGVIRSVELRAGEGLFGDLHFNPKHALAEQLLWDAQHNPHNVGFSHNVLAQLSRERETAVVEAITKVQSVDLVADPATTQGLFEQHRDVNRNNGSDQVALDALTREVLELHRPDLLKELESAEVQRLRQQLDDAEARANYAQRRQRVTELLGENQLWVSAQAERERRDPRRVSPTFVESLLNIVDEAEVRELITERAELASAAATVRSSDAQAASPFSREQTFFAANPRMPLATAEEFATALKSSLN